MSRYVCQAVLDLSKDRSALSFGSISPGGKPSTRREPLAQRHSVIYQKTGIFASPAIRHAHVLFVTTATAVPQLRVRTLRHKFGELMPRCVMHCPAHVPRRWYKTYDWTRTTEPACCTSITATHVLPAVRTTSTSPANNFFHMFLEVQSHMCFTAWDDATGGEGLLMGSRRETGEKTERGYVKRGAGGSLRQQQQQQAASLLLPAVNKLHMWWP